MCCNSQVFGLWWLFVAHDQSHIARVVKSRIGRFLFRFETNMHSLDHQEKRYNKSRTRINRVLACFRCCSPMEQWKKPLSAYRPAPDTDDEMLIHMAITELKLDELRNNIEVLVRAQDAPVMRQNAYFLDDTQGADASNDKE